MASGEAAGVGLAVSVAGVVAALGVSVVAAGAGFEVSGVTILGAAGGAGDCFVNMEISDATGLTGAWIGAEVGVALTDAATIVVSTSSVLVVGRRQV
jgi:hypothetical protein